MLERTSPILLVSHRPLFGQMGEFLLEILHCRDVDQFLREAIVHEDICIQRAVEQSAFAILHILSKGMFLLLPRRVRLHEHLDGNLLVPVYEGTQIWHASVVP